MLTSFITIDETGYGISVFIKKSDLERKNISTIITGNQLEVIDGEYQDAVLLNNDPSGLTKQQFKDAVRGGNLIGIVYNEITKELIEIRILDFDRK